MTIAALRIHQLPTNKRGCLGDTIVTFGSSDEEEDDGASQGRARAHTQTHSHTFEHAHVHSLTPQPQYVCVMRARRFHSSLSRIPSYWTMDQPFVTTPRPFGFLARPSDTHVTIPILHPLLCGAQIVSHFTCIAGVLHADVALRGPTTPTGRSLRAAIQTQGHA